MFFRAGSGLTCLDAHILLSLDPMMLKYDLGKVKHRTQTNTHTLDQSLREKKFHCDNILR